MLNLLIKPTGMKRISIILVSLIMISGCTGSKEHTGREVITVSIEPFRFFVSAVAGKDYEINVIVPPGASPATYEPSPAVIKSVSDSKMMIIDGYLGFEMAWMDRILGLNKDISLLQLAGSQDLISAGSHRHGDITHYTGVDPHFWISPARAKLIASDIRNFLIENMPGDSVLFNNNYLKLDSLITETDRYVREILPDSLNLSFMIFHPSLSYFALDYGLEQIAVEAEGKEPSPSELKKFIDTGREKNIRAVFVQREFDRKNAETIAKEIGAITVVIDPLSNDWVGAVREIAERIAGTK